MKLFKKFKNYQECKLCHVKLNSSITKKHLEMSHASELFKFRGKYLTSVKKVVKKLRNKNGREFKLDILEKLRDCDLVTYPEADYRLGKRKKISQIANSKRNFYIFVFLSGFSLFPNQQTCASICI